MTEEEKINLFKDILNTWGIENQVMMVMEESGEMLNALGKAYRGRLESSKEIITELADVSIMVEQMAVYFGYDEFLMEKEMKMQRVKERLAKWKAEHNK